MWSVSYKASKFNLQANTDIQKYSDFLELIYINLQVIPSLTHLISENISIH